MTISKKRASSAKAGSFPRYHDHQQAWEARAICDDMREVMGLLTDFQRLKSHPDATEAQYQVLSARLDSLKDAQRKYLGSLGTHGHHQSKIPNASPHRSYEEQQLRAAAPVAMEMPLPGTALRRLQEINTNTNTPAIQRLLDEAGKELQLVREARVRLSHLADQKETEILQQRTTSSTATDRTTRSVAFAVSVAERQYRGDLLSLELRDFHSISLLERSARLNLRELRQRHFVAANAAVTTVHYTMVSNTTAHSVLHTEALSLEERDQASGTHRLATHQDLVQEMKRQMASASASSASLSVIEGERIENELREGDHKQRIETERIEAERKQRIEAERVEAERVEAERVEAERKQRVEVERVKAERKQRIDAERVEAERKQRIEAERVEAERIDAERVEADRKQRVEAERVEAERKQRVEAERIEAERIEAERVEAERKQRVEAERVEAERIEADRVEADNAVSERINANQDVILLFKACDGLFSSLLRDAAMEVRATEIKSVIVAGERILFSMLRDGAVAASRGEHETERLEKERIETARLEKERIEAERLEKERIETERLEKERIEAERLEKERLEAERLEKERIEANRTANSAENVLVLEAHPDNNECDIFVEACDRVLAMLLRDACLSIRASEIETTIAATNNIVAELLRNAAIAANEKAILTTLPSVTTTTVVVAAEVSLGGAPSDANVSHNHQQGAASSEEEGGAVSGPRGSEDHNLLSDNVATVTSTARSRHGRVRSGDLFTVDMLLETEVVADDYATTSAIHEIHRPTAAATVETETLPTLEPAASEADIFFAAVDRILSGWLTLGARQHRYEANQHLTPEHDKKDMDDEVATRISEGDQPPAGKEERLLRQAAFDGLLQYVHQSPEAVDGESWTIEAEQRRIRSAVAEEIDNAIRLDNTTNGSHSFSGSVSNVIEPFAYAVGEYFAEGCYEVLVSERMSGTTASSSPHRLAPVADSWSPTTGPFQNPIKSLMCSPRDAALAISILLEACQKGIEREGGATGLPKRHIVVAARELQKKSSNPINGSSSSFELRGGLSAGGGMMALGATAVRNNLATDVLDATLQSLMEEIIIDTEGWLMSLV